MRLIDYISHNPVESAMSPRAYDEIFPVSSITINLFINILEMIDNIILNNLANQNRAPYRLIKKRTEMKER